MQLVQCKFCSLQGNEASSNNQLMLVSFFAPLSELYGRLPIYHSSNILFTLFSILSAVSPNLPALIIFRFLSGASGAAPLAIGGGTIADLIRPERRGLVVSVYFVGPILGPALGPVAAGYISQDLGWRWIFWVTAIPVSACRVPWSDSHF